MEDDLLIHPENWNRETSSSDTSTAVGTIYRRKWMIEMRTTATVCIVVIIIIIIIIVIPTTTAK